jgi:hypothetical protein
MIGNCLLKSLPYRRKGISSGGIARDFLVFLQSETTWAGQGLGGPPRRDPRPMTSGTIVSNGETLFGMPVRTGRWVFVLAGMLLNACLGTVYAWSVFRTPVARLFSTADVPITAKQTSWPVFIQLLALFTLMPIS